MTLFTEVKKAAPNRKAHTSNHLSLGLAALLIHQGSLTFTFSGSPRHWRHKAWTRAEGCEAKEGVPREIAPGLMHGNSL